MLVELTIAHDLPGRYVQNASTVSQTFLTFYKGSRHLSTRIHSWNLEMNKLKIKQTEGRAAVGDDSLSILA